jgi:2-polyprenyl-3-methyl-5-hydroxy-6-metoxy-1,4-benzoquinol methylase
MTYKQQSTKPSIPKNHKAEYKKIAELCEGKVLDYGCNNCCLALFINKENYYGTDLIIQKDRYSDNVFGLNKLKRKKFDTIVLCHVLEHVNSPADTLLNIYNKNLNNNGKIIVVVPNLCSLKKCIAVLIGYPLGTHEHHIQGWSYAELRVLASKISSKYVTFTFPRFSKENIFLVIEKLEGKR